MKKRRSIDEVNWNEVDWKALKIFIHEYFLFKSCTQEENDLAEYGFLPDLPEVFGADIRTSIEERFKKELVEYLKDDPINEVPILKQNIIDNEDGCFLTNWVNNFVWNYNLAEIIIILDEYLPKDEVLWVDDTLWNATVKLIDLRNILSSVEARKWRKEVYDLLIKFWSCDLLIMCK